MSTLLLLLLPLLEPQQPCQFDFPGEPNYCTVTLPVDELELGPGIAWEPIEFESSEFRIEIGGRAWAKITPEGDVVCYGKDGQPEPCDCAKMLLAAMIAGRVP